MLSLLVELVERTSTKRFVPSSVRGSHTESINLAAANNNQIKHSLSTISTLLSCVFSGFWISCARSQPSCAQLVCRTTSVNTETAQTTHRLIKHFTRNHVFFVLVPRSSQAGDSGQAGQTRRAQKAACSASKGVHIGAREWRCSRGTLKKGTSRYVHY